MAIKDNDLVKLIGTFAAAVIKVPFATREELSSIDQITREMFILVEGPTSILATAYFASNGFKGVFAYAAAISLTDFIVRTVREIYGKKGLHAGQKFDYDQPGIIGTLRQELASLVYGSYF